MKEDPSVRYGGVGDAFWNKRENGSLLGLAIDKISYCLNREKEREREEKNEGRLFKQMTM
jgi:hypothetical protein